MNVCLLNIACFLVNCYRIAVAVVTNKRTVTLYSLPVRKNAR